ncbi:hypothetical protein FACS1894202_08340 [Clostridia bacterium]|nr:hypothetical protein FACS1894202_08340 [Clostridia bacterium]
MNSMEDIKDLTGTVRELVKPGVFAFLAVLTREGDAVFMVIGGAGNPSITEVIQEAAVKYPGCKMRLFEDNYNSGYFKGIVSREQML